MLTGLGILVVVIAILVVLAQMGAPERDARFADKPQRGDEP